MDLLSCLRTKGNLTSSFKEYWSTPGSSVSSRTSLAMHRLPPEILDIILRYIPPDGLDGRRASYAGDSPVDSRCKSDQSRSLHGQAPRFSGQPSLVHKFLRLVIPLYRCSTRLAFRTLFLHPHEKSFLDLVAISNSRLADHVHHVVISLPFLTQILMENFVHMYRTRGSKTTGM